MANPGVDYQARRPKHYAFLARVLVNWKALHLDKRTSYQLGTETSAWAFARWIENVNGFDRSSMRNVLLYFLYPDFFERCLVTKDKLNIAKAFRSKLSDFPATPPAKMALIDIDQAVYEIRKAFEYERRTQMFDFYVTPGIREIWDPKQR